MVLTDYSTDFFYIFSANFAYFGHLNIMPKQIIINSTVYEDFCSLPSLFSLFDFA